MPEKAHSWQELLKVLTERPAERQRVADELGVTPYTITRWVSGTTEPRLRSLKRLPDVFPRYRWQFLELLQAELLSELPPRMPDIGEYETAGGVPLQYIARALAAYATTSGPHRAWSLRSLTLQQALAHLDAEHLGMTMGLFACVAPGDKTPCVRSLCLISSVGTPPWPSGPVNDLCFVGRETLTGRVISRGEPGIIQDWAKRIDRMVSPLEYNGIPARGVAAWPLQRESKVAGCLTIVTTQKDYFTPARLALIELYVNTLALSFTDREFYSLEYICLHTMPPVVNDEEWKAIQTRFYVYVDEARQAMRASSQLATERDAEREALQRIEAEILR